MGIVVPWVLKVPEPELPRSHMGDYPKEARKDQPITRGDGGSRYSLSYAR